MREGLYKVASFSPKRHVTFGDSAKVFLVWKMKNPCVQVKKTIPLSIGA